VDTRVSRVMDLKAPGSGESHRNLYENIPHLTPHDQVKFVISSRSDYDWARLQCDQHGLYGRVSDVLFSPGHETLKP
ncbi:7-carboxy-7-deazaguanine synthase QueE, partial [Acinetobacter baumannii]